MAGVFGKPAPSTGAAGASSTLPEATASVPRAVDRAQSEDEDWQLVNTDQATTEVCEM